MLKKGIFVSLLMMIGTSSYASCLTVASENQSGSYRTSPNQQGVVCFELTVPANRTFIWGYELTDNRHYQVLVLDGANVLKSHYLYSNATDMMKIQSGLSGQLTIRIIPIAHNAEYSVGVIRANGDGVTGAMILVNKPITLMNSGTTPRLPPTDECSNPANCY